jgi:hypothetical protein
VPDQLAAGRDESPASEETRTDEPERAARTRGRRPGRRCKETRTDEPRVVAESDGDDCATRDDEERAGDRPREESVERRE